MVGLLRNIRAGLRDIIKITNNWVIKMADDEKLQQIAKQLLNNLIEKYGVSHML